MNATMSLFEICQQPVVDKQKAAQITTDVAALLGHASNEISFKRRMFIKSVIKPEYKDLCGSTTKITENLLGDDLPKQIKELNTTNKLGNKYNQKRFYKGSDSYRNQL